VGIYAGTAAENATRSAEVAARELVSLTMGVEDAELNRCKAQLKASLFMGRESTLARAEQGAGQVLLFDRLFTPAEIAEWVDAVTAADIRAFGTKMLEAKAIAGAVLGPRPALKAGEAFQRALFG
jgi:predicted Zn-dependent peptidase